MAPGGTKVRARRPSLPSERSSLDPVFRSRPRDPAARSARGRELHLAHADPGAGDPPCPRRPRPSGHRPDRHRQDGGLRAADPASAGGRAPPAPAAHLPRPGAGTHPRAGQPDRGQLPDLRQEPAPDLHRRLRRRRHAPPAADHGARRRHPGGDAGPAGRPSGPALDPARPGRGRGAGRGRPHARHRLHPRHPARDEPCAEAAPEPVLLGHPAQRHRGARGRAAQEPRDGQASSRPRPRPSGSSSAWSMSTRRPRRRCSPSSWPSPRSPAPSCSPAPSTAPTR